MAARASRMAKELKDLETKPPEGVSAWPINDSLFHLEAKIQGPTNTVYADGWFQLSIEMPDMYPFEPPKVRFTTPVYHPNIDNSGRICLDILNVKPKGSWSPALNLRTVLAGIRQLLAEPNPKDGLMPEITQEYEQHRELFNLKARDMVRKHACGSSSTAAAQGAGTSSHSSHSQPAGPAPAASGAVAGTARPSDGDAPPAPSSSTAAADGSADAVAMPSSSTGDANAPAPAPSAAQPEAAVAAHAGNENKENAAAPAAAAPAAAAPAAAAPAAAAPAAASSAKVGSVKSGGRGRLCLARAAPAGLPQSEVAKKQRCE